MNKVFLYLYPIKEFASVFWLGDDYYDKNNVHRPFDVLNETIQKRYRDKGYQVVFALYPDRKIYGVIPTQDDKIIYTDVLFSQVRGYKQDGSISYPNEQMIINQLASVDELVIGGYHAHDCVKRVAETAFANGINTHVDLDMTDLFFNLYRQDDYFEMESYSPERFKKHMLEELMMYGEEFALEIFNRNYQGDVYGFERLNKRQK